MCVERNGNFENIFIPKARKVKETTKQPCEADKSVEIQTSGLSRRPCRNGRLESVSVLALVRDVLAIHADLILGSYRRQVVNRDRGL